MERKIYLSGVTSMSFSDFLAEFVDDIAVDCSLTRDISKSNQNEKSNLLAQQGYCVKGTATFPQTSAVGVTLPIITLTPSNNLQGEKSAEFLFTLRSCFCFI